MDSDAVADPCTVVVHSEMTVSTCFAVVRARREHLLADVAEEELAEVRQSVQLLIALRYLLRCGCRLELHKLNLIICNDRVLWV